MDFIKSMNAIKREDFYLIMSTALCFMLPLSTFLTNFCLMIVFSLWLFFPLTQARLATLKTFMYSKPGLVILGFFSLLLLGSLYSEGSVGDILQTLQKMSKLLWLPILTSLFIQSRARKYALFSFVLAMLLTAILGFCAVYFGFSGRHYDAAIFRDHIYTNFLMGYAAFIVAHWLPNLFGFWRYLGAILLIFFIFYIYFLSSGRAGYIIFGFLFLLFGWQRYGFKGVLATMVTLSLIIGGAFVGSKPFYQRAEQALEGVKAYQRNEKREFGVSDRLEFMKSSFELVKRRPIFGFGTGSFKTIYRDYATEHHLSPTDNPHNEYLNMVVQLGGVGLFALVGFFLCLWKAADSCPILEKYLAQGAISSIAIGCIANAWLMDFTTRHFLIIILALCFAAIPKKVDTKYA